MLAVSDAADGHAARITHDRVYVHAVFVARISMAGRIDPNRAQEIFAVKGFELGAEPRNAARTADALDEAERGPGMIIGQNPVSELSAVGSPASEVTVLEIVHAEIRARPRLVRHDVVEEAVNKLASVVFDVSSHLVVLVPDAAREKPRLRVEQQARRFRG